jgi:5-methyltetrahydrofolate--homocysteine methyltransferase
MDAETQKPQAPIDEPIVPPFWGAQVWEPSMEEVNPFIERMALLVGRWGYKKGNLSEGEYRQILEGEAQGHYERLVRENMERRLFVPRAAVAWHTCKPEGDVLHVYPHGGGEPCAISFPRQKIREKLCIPDFYAPDGDVLGCFTVTVGSPEASEEMRRLQDDGEYQEYFFWSGFAGEYADAVAEWAHRKMLEPIGGKRGARFGPGYPSCPDMTLSRKICEWSEASRIGVTVTESDMLDPEMSTSAILAHRPRARIFNTLG